MTQARLIFAAALALVLLSVPSFSAESRTLIMGVWPNEIRLLDEGTEQFVGTIQLRYGAVTGYGRTPHTPDYRRLFYITDRMEAVEVVDPVSRQVVDELRLSTPARRVRILGLSPYPDGSAVILRVVAVGMDIDRFEAEDTEYIVYDLNSRAQRETFRLPKDVRTDFTSPFPFASDGKTFFAFDTFGRAVYELSLTTHEVVSKIPLDMPREAGYSGLRPSEMFSSEPGVYYSLATATDPFMKKKMSGVVRIDLGERTASSFEIGPRVDADVFALSSDGKTGYAGLRDLVKIDMATERIVAMKKEFVRGRAATVLIPSADGTKLFVTGVGDAIRVVDAETLEVVRTIELGRDLMANPLALPAGLSARAASR